MTLPCEPDVGAGQKIAAAGSHGGSPVQALFEAAGAAPAGSMLRRAYDVAAACHEGQLRLAATLTSPIRSRWP
jgi:hypothetical protein